MNTNQLRKSFKLKVRDVIRLTGLSPSLVVNGLKDKTPKTEKTKNAKIKIKEILEKYNPPKESRKPVIQEEFIFEPKINRVASSKKINLIKKVLCKKIENYIISMEQAFENLMEFEYLELKDCLDESDNKITEDAND
jgi:hypothetical protein